MKTNEISKSLRLRRETDQHVFIPVQKKNWENK